MTVIDFDKLVNALM